MFDQQHLVCTNWFEVDCQQSVAIFINDFGQKKTAKTKEEPEYEYEEYYYAYEEENPLAKDDSNSNQNQQQNRFLVDSSPATKPRGSQGAGGERTTPGFQVNMINRASGHRG